MSEKKLNKKVVLRLLFSLAIIALFLGAFYLVAYLLGWTKLTKEELQAFLVSKGAIAPLIFIAISFLQVTFIPIPSAVTIVAGSYMFGFWQSFLYSYIGIILGSLLAFFLGKFIGRPFINWAFGGKEETDNYMKRLKGKESVVMFFMFLLPVFPDDALCALAGILPIGWFKFIFMQLTTRVTSILGTLLFMSGEIIPYSGWGLAVIIVVAVLSIIAFIFCFKYADKINAAFDKAMDKLAGAFRKKKPVDAKNSASEDAEQPDSQTTDTQENNDE